MTRVIRLRIVSVTIKFLLQFITNPGNCCAVYVIYVKRVETDSTRIRWAGRETVMYPVVLCASHSTENVYKRLGLPEISFLEDNHCIVMRWGEK